MTKYYVRILFAFIIFCINSTICFSQKFSTSINAQLAVPQNEYKDVNPDAGYGLRASLLYKPVADIPLKFGFEIGIQEKARAAQYFASYYDQFKVSATSNIFSLMFFTRFQSGRFGKIKPFIDLTAGWNVFFSTVSVDQLTYYSPYNTGYSNSSKSQWALAYGLAGGVDIPLNRRDDIGLELKLAYVFGNNSKYLTDPYIDNNANASFVEQNSRTDMLIPQAGIRITIK